MQICRNRARLNCLLIVLGGLRLETTETARDHCRLHIQYTKRPLPPKCVKEGVKTIWMAWEEVNCVLTAMVVHGVHTIYHSLASPESLISGLLLSGIYPAGRNKLFQIFTRPSASVMSVTQDHFYSIFFCQHILYYIRWWRKISYHWLFIRLENKSGMFLCFVFFFLDLDVWIRFPIVDLHIDTTNASGRNICTKEETH